MIVRVAAGLCAVAVAGALPGPAAGQVPMASPMPGMAASGAAGAISPEIAANRDAMAQMHAAMTAVAPTGDADRDFVAGMIPHHEGAIGMAQVELRYGRDAGLRALARRIDADQRREVAVMRRWQAAHPAR